MNVVKKILNPSKFINKVGFTITNIKAGEDDTDKQDSIVDADGCVGTDTDLNNDNESFHDIGEQRVDFSDDGNATVSIKSSDDHSGTENFQVNVADGDNKDKGEDFLINKVEGEKLADGKTVASSDNLNTPINPKEPWLNYRYPTLSLLKKYDEDNKPNIDMNEQLANKNRIVEVLNSFGVQIKTISATVGPTITLYEITPAEGVKISKIRNLEDDIALSLKAAGVRIIAPIPGKGTIGIEVPNAKANIVSMESILNSEKFQKTTFDLPIALGKTITNEVFMVDLAKIPHLLVAGATGQGKSVGLNAIITSLLYKKHPNEMKIVLIDPKRWSSAYMLQLPIILWQKYQMMMKNRSLQTLQK